MSSAKKMLLSAAGVGGGGLDVAEVFSTFLYNGTDSNQTITNDIDLSGEGGLIWTKQRGPSDANNHIFIDTERGLNKWLESNTTDADGTHQYITSVSDTGYVIPGNTASINQDPYKMVSWTFRKAEKFFDVVTYTGNGASSRAISHNLNSVPGVIIIKQRSGSSENWIVFHRSISNSSNGKNLFLNTNDAENDMGGKFDQSNLPTSQTFTIGNDNSVNAGGSTYVAYLFAHNDGDGEFGPDSDQDIISCGSFTSNASGAGLVGPDLGYEPQWVLLKNATSNASGNWWLVDSMRGFTATGGGTAYLRADTSAVEGAFGGATLNITNNGFTMPSNAFAGGETFIYMAIRAPMITEPEAATDVFAMDTSASSTAQAASPPVQYYAGFPVDMMLKGSAFNASGANYSHARLTNGRLRTDSTAAETAVADHFDSNQGYRPISLSANTNYIAYLFKRAKGYFDVVAYSGNSSYPRNISHSLGVVPEMMWVKTRNAADNWRVYSKDMTVQQEMLLNGTYAASSTGSWGTGGRPTDSVFITGSANTNYSGRDYIAYLFATLAGISKVGSVAHSGSSTDVNCGFSNGARFVMLKRTDATGDWYYWDSVRGIIAGNDPYLLLNSNAAHVTNTDLIDPLSSGFQISGDFTDGDYIFYAIA